MIACLILFSQVNCIMGCWLMCALIQEHPGVFQPPKLTKWEKRMKWGMDYSRTDVRLWNQTSVQRWVNWISLPSVPSPVSSVSAEVPWSPGPLLGNQTLVSPAGCGGCGVVFPSRRLVFICLHVGIVGGPAQAALPGGIASCKKLSTRFDVLWLPVWAHYWGLASAVQFITLRLSNLFLSGILRKCD